MRNSIFERKIKRKISCHDYGWANVSLLSFYFPVSFFPLPLFATQATSSLVAVDGLHACMVGDLVWSF